MFRTVEVPGPLDLDFVGSFGFTTEEIVAAECVGKPSCDSGALQAYARCWSGVSSLVPDIVRTVLNLVVLFVYDYLP